MERRLPTVYGYREHVVAGGLISYGVDLRWCFYRGAYFVDRILRGTAPGDEAYAVGGLLCGVGRPRVVEARLAYHPEADLAADRFRASDDVVRLLAIADRHEIRYLGHAILGEKARQQNSGVGQVELFLPRALEEGGELEAPAPLIVQQGGEDGRRVEARRSGLQGGGQQS